MIEQISVRNIGCFGDELYTVDFSEETLIAGPNNSGKSMFLAALNLFRYYVVTRHLDWKTSYYNLESFDAAVHNHELNRPIYTSVKLKENGDTYIFDFQVIRNGPVRLLVNKSPINPGQQPYSDFMKNIWCLSPNRSLVPYLASVQSSSGPIQPLRPNGSNVINFLLERWTDRDENWEQAEYWLRKIDPDMSKLKTPIEGSTVSLETLFGDTDVNVSMQGSGFQSAAAIVSAVIFSPEGSTVILEEPEAFLHPSSQEVIVDVLNHAVNNQNKQIIFSTHSCNILLPFYNDVGLDAPKRSEEHVIADPKKFGMWTFEKSNRKVAIKKYPLHSKTFKNFRQDFKYIWG